MEAARQNAINTINIQLVKANWEIGRHIAEFEQQGEERAEYGSALLARLSSDLKLRYGKGFGRRNILDMRRLYLAYQKWQAVPAKLSWTHFVALLAISDDTTWQKKMKCWWSMLWAEYQIKSLCRNTSCTCPIKNNCKEKGRQL